MYRAKGAAAQLFACYDREVLIEGPAGTGKTRAVLEYSRWIAETYPGAQILFLRKARVWLSETILPIWEKEVLEHFAWSPHEAVVGEAKMEHRIAYEWRNGSRVKCGGVNDPHSYMSGQYDLVVVFEAAGGKGRAGITADDWEMLLTRCRHHRIPHPMGSYPDGIYDHETGETLWDAFKAGKLPGGVDELGQPIFLEQAIADCNPGARHHWLNARASDGKMTRLLSRHEDNPTVTDAYLESLRNLTGHRRQRLYEGKWASAEGLIYPDWNELNEIDLVAKKNAVTGQWMGPPVPRDKHGQLKLQWYIAGLDWGWTNPGCLGVWGFDAQRRAYLVAEIYRSQKKRSWWAERAVELWEEYNIRRIVCDHDPDGIAVLNDFLQRKKPIGQRRDEEMPRVAIPAIKSKPKRAGWDLVRSLMAPQDDGLPMMFACRDTLRYGRDPELAETHPHGWCEEIEDYTFAEWEEGKPIDKREDEDPTKPNHAMDEGLYAMTWAWKKDLTDPAPFKPFKPGTYGYEFEHDKLPGGRPL